MHVERSVAPESTGGFDAQRQHEPWYVASKDAGVMLTRCPMAGLASLWKPRIQEYHVRLTHVGQASKPNRCCRAGVDMQRFSSRGGWPVSDVIAGAVPHRWQPVLVLFR